MRPLVVGVLVAAVLLVWWEPSARETPPSRPRTLRGGSGRQARGQDGAPGRDGRGPAGRPRWPLRDRRRPGGARRQDELISAVDALAAALEAGLPAPLAVDVAVRASSEPEVGEFLRRLVEAPDEALPPVPSATPPSAAPPSVTPPSATPMRPVESGAELLTRSWRLCHDVGAPLADATRTVAALLRTERARTRAVAAALAEARATVRILVGLPLFGPALAAGIGVMPADLYATPAAVASGVAGLALLVVGRWWMARLVRRIDATPQLSAATPNG
ncbi:MAG: type II secretion system F family protein [Dermatophilaceae bacterium]